MHITFLLFIRYSKHILTPYQYGWVSCICTRLNTGCGCRCVQQLVIRSDPDTLYLKLRKRQRTVALTARQHSRDKEENKIPLRALRKGEKRTQASSMGTQSGTAQNSFKTADLGPYSTGRHSRGPRIC